MRETFFKAGHVEYLYGLANVRALFPDIDSRFKFTMLGVMKGGETTRFRALFLLSHAEWPSLTQERNASNILADVLADESRFLDMTVGLMERLSPHTLSVMELRTRADHEIVEKLVFSAPSIGQEIANTWNPRFISGLHKTNHRALFSRKQEGLPIYEGKNLGYYGEVLRPPDIWMLEETGRSLQPDYNRYRFGFRRIARGTDIRTLIVSYVPKMAFSMYTLTTIVQGLLTKAQEVYLYACMASFILDYLMRFQVSSSVAIFNVQTLPIHRLSENNPYLNAIVPRAARLTCTTPEFAGLWVEVMGEPWEASQGATEPEERQRLRDELDALVAHLYGLSRAQFAHILGTFPLVFPDTQAGQARKEALLQVYERFAEVVAGWERA